MNINPETMTRTELVDFLKSKDAYAGHSRDGIGELRKAVAALVAPTAIQATDVASRATRLKAAKAEAAELKAWTKAGSKGKRPATPNLDELDAESNGSKPKPAVAKKSSTKVERSQRAEQASAAKKAAGGKRGRGKRMTEDEVEAWITKALKANPGTTHATERQYFYWVEGLTCSRQLFSAVFERVAAKLSKAA